MPARLRTSVRGEQILRVPGTQPVPKVSSVLRAECLHAVILPWIPKATFLHDKDSVPDSASTLPASQCALTALGWVSAGASPTASFLHGIHQIHRLNAQDWKTRQAQVKEGVQKKWETLTEAGELQVWRHYLITSVVWPWGFRAQLLISQSVHIIPCFGDLLLLTIKRKGKCAR